MDVGEVMAYADGFGRAVAADKKELISRYVKHEEEKRVSEVLELLPRPIEAAEVLQVELRDSGESISLIRFSGRREEVRLRAVWVGDGDQAILIRAARIFGRMTRQLAS
jgi:23S rRNA C2498 (ribose-2'-O)-methylase RlmM